jgi:hypothetical protein
VKTTVIELVKTDGYKLRARIYQRILEGLDSCQGKAQWNGRCAALTLICEYTEKERLGA